MIESDYREIALAESILLGARAPALLQAWLIPVPVLNDELGLAAFDEDLDRLAKPLVDHSVEAHFISATSGEGIFLPTRHPSLASRCPSLGSAYDGRIGRVTYPRTQASCGRLQRTTKPTWASTAMWSRAVSFDGAIRLP